MKCASETSAIHASRGMQSGSANVRSIASLARSIRRLHSSTDRFITLLYTGRELGTRNALHSVTALNNADHKSSDLIGFLIPQRPSDILITRPRPVTRDFLYALNNLAGNAWKRALHWFQEAVAPPSFSETPDGTT